MSFLDHLEELRWHLIRSVIAILVFAIAAFIYKDFVWGTIIFGPSKADFWTFRMLCKLGELVNSDLLCITDLPYILQSRKITGQFTMHLSGSFVIGLVCAFPYFFWEIWRFIKPGLHTNEKKVSRGAVFFVSLLFFSGILFGYFIVSPLSFNFLSNYQIVPGIKNQFDIISYVSFFTTLVLACGILFQIPMVTLFLSKAGILTPDILRKYAKHAIIVILFVSAVLTPPDIISQVLIAAPLTILYQISIFISARIEKKNKKFLE
ncbi:twin-arginine translocase subunit TatC [Fulvivirgaceae bacterium BMA10]|uniref:Sec-independent protein translocase protein TatC n=2 Tax=Splendidivirga corallicola TaxID=3051826 RepID=A0ABT8KWJ8_9BACT|nr:twin-arginine translocase subunit TatC [Fulvivirgaceae bacterium BMA10]